MHPGSSDEDIAAPMRTAKPRRRRQLQNLGFCLVGFGLGLICVVALLSVLEREDGMDADVTQGDENGDVLSASDYNRLIAHKSVAEADLFSIHQRTRSIGADLYTHTGEHKNLTLYHQTSREICEAIMEHNFQIGRGGLCGKAIYFALSPQVTATKAITANSHGGCMIEAVVDVGKQDYYYWRGGPDQRFKKSCGGWNEMTGERLHGTGFDTIVMRQGDGDEIVVFEPERVLERRIVPFKCEWMCRGQCQKDWPPECQNQNHGQEGGAGGGGGWKPAAPPHLPPPPKIKWPPPPPKIKWFR